MKVNYTPKGICAKNITFDLEDGIVRNVVITGGCPGNHLGLSALTEGMRAEEIVKRLENIDCGGKGTSCPDQLAQAIKENM